MQSSSAAHRVASRAGRITLPLPPPPPPTATPPAPPHGRPTDLLELRAAEEAQQQQGRLSRKEGGGADPFPYSDEVPPAKRDWKAEGKITPVKVRPRA